jgi:hypothetical protein
VGSAASPSTPARDTPSRPLKHCAYAATATTSRADPHILYHAVSHGRRNASRPE